MIAYRLSDRVINAECDRCRRVVDQISMYRPTADIHEFEAEYRKHVCWRCIDAAYPEAAERAWAKRELLMKENAK